MILLSLEDFEKPLKISKNSPEVYKGWNEKRSKSKSSLFYYFSIG
jgi:hypothetical protein